MGIFIVRRAVFRPLTGYLVIVTISLFLPSLAGAELLTLQTGQKIQGQILERNSLRVTVDVKGAPYTFFLGEIASIDGHPLSMPKDKAVTVDLALQDRVPAPYYGDEQDSLIRFMNIKNSNTASLNSTADQKAPVAPTAAVAMPSPASNAPAPAVASMGANRTVIATSDGGIIIVSPDKLTKYDQDFKIVKEVNLTAAK